MPKQFARLFDGASLFQRTVKTNSRICSAQYIVSNADQYFLAKDQLEEVGANDVRFLLEPVGRNTAPAIALACLGLDPEDVVLVSPSDHVIRKAEAYEECLRKAEEFAKKGFMVTFGITPTGPETGYGYIEANGEDVKRFVESRTWKPPRSMSLPEDSSGTAVFSASRLRRSSMNFRRTLRIS
jgi:mannose-1-phosphate guanylyltransferase